MTAFLDIRSTVLSQYANSPVILSLLDQLGAAFDGQARVDGFYTWVWNIDTALGFGLDLWGRILGVSRALYVLPDNFFGFSDQTEALPFNQGVFYSASSLTTNYNLSDDAYRVLLLVKAALNITNSSIRSINSALMTLFPNYGNSYVRDNGDMTMTYVFGAALSKIDYAIVTQSGALPKPVGVSFTVETP
jgi:hypothetical protein